MSPRPRLNPLIFPIRATLCAAAAALLLALACGPQRCLAEGCVVVGSRHAWGAFKLGSWKKVRVVSETLGSDGKVESTRETETKSTLVEVDSEGYTLRIESRVKLAGRQFDSSRYVRCRFSGEGDDEHVSFENLEPATVTIGNKQIPSRVQRIVANGGATRRVSLVHYNHEVSPFVLKRSTVSLDAKTESELGKTVVEVLDTSLERNILNHPLTVSQVKTTRSDRSGRSETFELCSEEVPGGVVSHESQQFDDEGNVVSRSTLELVGYGIGDGRPRLFPRLFPRLRSRGH